jgi:uncharacterized protein (DUF427 family)
MNDVLICGRWIETELKNAAWYYPDPKEKAMNIKDYVAFCKLLSVVREKKLMRIR